jgi:hypothetical protein
MSDHRRAPIWPAPVTIIGISLVTLGFVIWSAARHDTTTTGRQSLSRWERAELECDRQMQILMSTKDLVELERAKFLVDQLNCSVSRRLPPP